MVHSVVEDSPAEEAGIKAGDIILEVNGEPVHEWGDMQTMTNLSEEGEEITLLLQKEGKQNVSVELTPRFDPELQRQTIGVLLCWNMVSQVEEGSPAYGAGIRPGDTILSINEQPIYNNESMSRALNSVKEGEGILLVLLRGEETASTSLIQGPDLTHRSLGFELHWVDNAHIEQRQLPTWKAIYLGGSYIVNMPALMIDAIPLIKESPDKALVGPIGAGQLTVEFVESFGLSNILFMAGIISLGIALFNFFPIPPLDGGGMLVALIEGVRHGKRLSPRAVRLAYVIGTTLLITLMVLITFSDILRLWRGESFGL
jgi:regulator of sigma E protease